MIQIIGLIVAVYAVARLLQVPIEHSGAAKKTELLTLVAMLAIVAIGILTGFLLTTGMDLSDFRR